MIMAQPKDRPSMQQLSQACNASRATTCPRCKQDGFHATSTWRLVDGQKRRARTCRWCKFVQNETVPEPVPD